MKIEFPWPNHADLVPEVGDEVALVNTLTREPVTELVRLQEIPCRIEWNVEHEGHLGWGLYEQGRLFYIGDPHWVRPGDIYTLEVPGWRSP